MKSLYYLLRQVSVMYLILMPTWLLASPSPTPTLPYPDYGDSTMLWVEPFVAATESEFLQLENQFLNETEPLRTRLFDVNRTLSNPKNRSAECGFELLWERLQLEETLDGLTQEHELKLLKLRYRKSVEIVKMLYEKVLSMDHHFSSLKAQHGLLNLSNPHNYPEFKETKTLIEERMKKKYNFELPALLQTNPFMSAAFSIVGLALGSGDDKEKKTNVDNIACILDFTVRMHNDLNIIYYETGYLRDANLTLKKECEALFSECARQVGYSIPLISCRDSDDWERLYGMLDTYVSKALGEIAPTTGGNNQAPGSYYPPAGGTGMPAAPDQRLVSRATTNLQFSIDRVAQFIEKYGNFVGQGGEYYKKFSKIVDNYENEKKCSSALPDQFKQLKTDINETLDKFNSAYKMPEVQGSKLKDMLYGVSLE